VPQQDLIKIISQNTSDMATKITVKAKLFEKVSVLRQLPGKPTNWHILSLDDLKKRLDDEKKRLESLQ